LFDNAATRQVKKRYEEK